MYSLRDGTLRLGKVFSFDAVGVVSPEVSFRRKNISFILNSDWKSLLWWQHGYFACDAVFVDTT